VTDRRTNVQALSWQIPRLTTLRGENADKQEIQTRKAAISAALSLEAARPAS